MPPPALLESKRDRAVADLLRFTALNALSFEVLAGQILILFARQVGASLADIGLLSALLPFAAVIQLGIAPLINRYGPRALMLVGWSLRTLVAAALFAVPLAASRGPEAGTQALIVIMLAFYLCRALGMSSWLPMVQEIVRPQDRGFFLSRQEWLRQVSIVAINIVTAVYLLNVPGLTRYMHVIGIGVVAAAWSLYYLWRIPDPGGATEPLDHDYLRRATAPLRDRVFVRYLLFSTSLRVVLTAFAPFLTVFLREGLQLPASGVIAVNTVSSLGAVATLAAWGRWTDRFGAKSILGMSIGGVAGCLAVWALAGNSALWQWAGAPGLSILTGIFMGGVTVSMSKFELEFIPVRHRAHYVALNVTAVGLLCGVGTLSAGFLLQSLAGVSALSVPTQRFHVLFVLCALLLLIPLALRRTLPDERERSLAGILRRALARSSRRLLARIGR